MVKIFSFAFSGPKKECGQVSPGRAPPPAYGRCGEYDTKMDVSKMDDVDVGRNAVRVKPRKGQGRLRVR